MIRVHLFISGRVQCVLFRDSMRIKALRFGVKGFVRNLSDGRVEAIVEGEKETVGRLIRWSRRGPLFAKVKNIDISEERYLKEFNKFIIKY